MEIFEDSRTVSRADLAAWLRQMASQLESDGKVLFGAAGSVTVSDEVHCELEIESSGSETSIEIEFTWKGAAAEPSATDEDDESGEDSDEDSGEESDSEEETEAEVEGAAEESSVESAAEEGAAEDEPETQPTAASVTPAAASNVFASTADLSSFAPNTPAAEPGSSAEEETGDHAGTTSTLR